jgi:signal transduction histidine kinase
VNSEWIKSPTARRVLLHWADARPAWLWSSDGETLLWRNTSARFFHGKVKKHGIKLAPEAAPIKGQISRLIRMGSVGRSSLSRIQFLAGDRPISTTCTVTPLELEGGTLAMLVVGVDPIEPELLEPPNLNGITEGFLPQGSDYILVDDDGQIAGGSRRALERYAPYLESEGIPDLPDSETGEASIAGETLTLTRFKASPRDAVLLLFEGGVPRRSISDVRADEGLRSVEAAEAQPPDEPLLPMGLPPAEPVAEPPAEPVTLEDHWVEPFEPRPQVPGLSNLFDRLADDEGLYAPLEEGDETFDGPLHENVGYVPPDVLPEEPALVVPTDEPVADAPAAEAPAPEQDIIAAVIEFADDEEHELPAEAEADSPADEPEERPVTWRVIGRGFIPLAGEPPVEEIVAEAAAIADGATPDTDTVERVSRYNFDELSRILTDRVGTEPPPPTEPERPVEPPRRVAAEGSLINLAAETFILNRLPIGIMVFRDQQVLFANRALTDLTGHEAVESLRAAGLAAIFPTEDSTGAGPVTHLMRRDGNRMPVRARLQSITWQGRPALMLSALAGEETRGHEGAVRAFAEIAADAREEGFLSADRSGTVTQASLHARVIFGKTEADIIGLPLTSLIDPTETPALREFLERPARFAETSRPSLFVRAGVPNAVVTLFAEGQAGVVTGYFGFVRNVHAPAVPEPAEAAAPKREDDVEPSMLARLSRSIRRPLNTIIGFSDLIRSSAFGTIENTRYLEYARDIKTAGNEIATLVDELDDFTRLKEGRYAARPAELDLGALLESCVVRVRGQAGNARVLVRSAISERLPKIRADRASLGQAVLNLLASAIDQTPQGASVILSAQVEDDGSISVNVRDSGERSADLGERFVVFRDGVGKDGEALAPVRSSVGLALTRSLLAVNTCSLSVDPSGGIGTLFSLVIPADLVAGT